MNENFNRFNAQISLLYDERQLAPKVGDLPLAVRCLSLHLRAPRRVGEAAGRHRLAMPEVPVSKGRHGEVRRARVGAGEQAQLSRHGGGVDECVVVESAHKVVARECRRSGEEGVDEKELAHDLPSRAGG